MFDQKLGHGAFGPVRLGLADGTLRPGEVNKVAVTMLKGMHSFSFP